MNLKKLDALQITFNPENVICISKKCIPFSVKFVVSLGSRFAFGSLQEDSINLEDFNITFERILDETNQFGQWFMLKEDLKNLYIALEKGLIPKMTKAQKFIRDQADLAMMFLKENRDIIIAPSDKGGKIIIMDKDFYESKMTEHLDVNMSSHTYYHFTNANIENCRSILEPKFENLRISLNKFLIQDMKCSRKNTMYPLAAEPYMIAKIFILLKAHKEGFPPRPIIAAPSAWGRNLSVWILGKLELISKLFDGIQVKGSEEFVEKLRMTKDSPSSHKLANWDYVSMFTNIPFNIAKEIIRENFSTISEETCVPMEIFIEAIAILVEYSSYFTYKEKIYRQTKGLTMGNGLSKMLAEIVTKYFTMKAINVVHVKNITFVSKFVDDFVGAMDSNVFGNFESGVTGGVKCLKVDRSDESLDGTITFLDVLIMRDKEYGFLTRWWQKECSAKQILNFHSAHPMYMKINVVHEFMRHALEITSPILFQTTIKNLKKTLRRSSYPISFIQEGLKKVLSCIGKVSLVSSVGITDENINLECEIATSNSRELKSNNEKELENWKFISCPYMVNGSYKKLKEIISKHKVKCRLAPKVIRQNRRMIFSRTKDKTLLSDIKFGIFSLCCNDCEYERFFRTYNLDMSRSIKHILNNNGSVINEHMRSNPGHSIPDVPCRVNYSNATDLKFTFEQFK